MNDRSESAPETGSRTPTHDQICTFDPILCRDCRLQAEARADEREQAAQRVEAVGWMDSGALRLHVIPTDEAVTAARGGVQADLQASREERL